MNILQIKSDVNLKENFKIFFYAPNTTFIQALRKDRDEHDINERY